MSVQAELRKIDQKKEDPASWTKMDLFRYPENLGSIEEPHYITFEINIKDKTTQYKKNPSKIRYEIKRDLTTSAQVDTSFTGLKAAGAAAAGVAVGAAVTGIAGKVFDAVTKTGSVSASAKKATALSLGVGAAAASAVALFGSDILQPSKTFRITDHIALQIDGPPQVKYSMNYANKDLGTLLGILSGSSFEAQNSNQLSSAGAAIGLQLAKLPGMFGAGDLGAAIGKGAGVALNPFKEVIFESVNFRSFRFKYKFLPRSKTETETVKQIIELFKYHMHPELHESKLFFVYPSEFQITYWYKGGANPYLFKFRPVVLEDMDVSYGGEMFSSFVDGAPTEINLSLTFRETEIITKNLIDKGEA